jgi:hypothetical protein
MSGALSDERTGLSFAKLIAPAVLVLTSKHGPHRKHPVSNSNSIVRRVFVAAGTCLRSRCPEKVVVYRVAAKQRVYTPHYQHARLIPL